MKCECFLESSTNPHTEILISIGIVLTKLVTKEVMFEKNEFEKNI